MNSTRTPNGIAGHLLDHDSETISSGRRGELPPDPDATLGKSHDREFIGNCGDHGSTTTQSTSTINHSDKSKSTREEEEKPIVTYPPSTLVCFCMSDWFHGCRSFTGFICSAVFLCFSLFLLCLSYSYVQQTKLASTLVNFWVHEK